MDHSDHPDLIELIDEHEETFETIANADDPDVAERFGRRPLRLLEHDRGRDQA